MPLLALLSTLALAAEPAWTAQARGAGYALKLPLETVPMAVAVDAEGQVWLAGVNRAGKGWIGRLQADGGVTVLDLNAEPIRALSPVKGGVAFWDGARVMRLGDDGATRVLAGPFRGEVSLDAYDIVTCGDVVTVVGLHNPMRSGVTELWRVTGASEWRYDAGGYSVLTDAICEGDEAVAIGVSGRGRHLLRGEALAPYGPRGTYSNSLLFPGLVVSMVFKDPSSPEGLDLLFEPAQGAPVRVETLSRGVDGLLVGEVPVVLSEGSASGGVWQVRGGAVEPIATLPGAWAQDGAVWEREILVLSAQRSGAATLRLISLAE